MKKVNVYMLRENLAKYLAEVEKTGDVFMVYKYRKPVATITPINNKETIDNLENYFGFLGKKGETGDKLIKRVRRNKKEKKYIENLRKGIL